MDQLKNKVAIVTGASSGIGRATARLFAREGAKLILAARRKPELDAVAQEIVSEGGSAIAVPGDIRNQDYAQTLVNSAIQHFGGLDIAFNNAGMLGELGPLTDMSLQNWQDTMNTNLTSAFLAAKYQIPAMGVRGGGSLVFTSTFVGHTIGIPGAAAYAATKAGLIGMMKVLAAELGPRGIRVNALLPGGTDTPMARAMIDSEETRSFIEGMHVLKRLAQPEEIAHSALYLASDASSFTTGTALLCEGGVSINKT